MRRFLVDGERMVVVHRPHAMSLFGTFFALFAGFVLTIAIGFTAPPSLGAVTNATWYVLAAMTVYTLITLWLWSRDWFMATNQRLVWRRGVFNQKTAMMPLSKVTDMSFNQPLLGRILGYGEFVMESAGQEQALRDIRWIPHPESAYRQICGELFADEQPPPPMVPVAAGATRIDDTDPNLPRALEPAAAPDVVSRALDEDALSRLGSYVDRYRTQARTPLRERLLRGPQPTEATPDHRMGTELHEVGDESGGAWAVSREDSTKVHWVDRDRDR